MSKKYKKLVINCEQKSLNNMITQTGYVRFQRG